MFRTPALGVAALFCTTAFGYTEGDISAQQLLSILDKGTPITGVDFKTDHDKNNSVTIYGLEGAAFFEADMDIDCDGEPDDKCNEQTDPWFYPAVSVGKGVYASQTPFFVIPVSYDHPEIKLGQLAAVIYKNQVVYGPLLDECGVDDVIGEASYAMAALLGINPDPQYGGTSDPVTYIIFTGAQGRLDRSRYTDHNAAIETGSALAAELVSHYGQTANRPGAPQDQIRMRAPNLFDGANGRIRMLAEGNHTLDVFSSTGQRVYHVQDTENRSHHITGLSAGVYVVRVTTAAAAQTRAMRW